MDNPLLSDTGCHYATARLRFVNGRLHQLWMPSDSAIHEPEWREVESADTQPAEQPAGLPEIKPV